MPCPACNSTMTPVAGKCPVCGFEFSSVVVPGAPGPVPGRPAGPSIAGAKRKSPLAVASLILGVCSFLGFSLFAAIPAVVTGHLAQRDIRKSNGALGGDGLAKAGLIIGYANIALSVLFFVLGALLW